MKKTKPKDEVDISEIVITLWKGKFKILLIVMITVIFTIYSKLNSKIEQTLYTATTQIIPMSTFDNYKFDAFNNYLLKSEIKKMDFELIYDGANSKKNKLSDTILKLRTASQRLFENTFLNQIDDVYLFDLFINKLNQKDLFINAIKKFDLLKKSDYKNNKDYENAVLKLASSIYIDDTLVKSEKKANIQFQTYNKITWIKLLEYLDKSVNLEIQNYLKNNFELYILSSEREKKYLLEDIEFEITNNLDDEKIINILMRLKKRTEESRTIKRLRDLYNNTPIIESNNFIAAKLDIQSTNFKSTKTQDSTSTINQLILISILLGTILGILYVLIANIIQKMKQLKL
jgi:hypothetical protein